jgi:hypothetical protein
VRRAARPAAQCGGTEWSRAAGASALRRATVAAATAHAPRHPREARRVARRTAHSRWTALRAAGGRADSFGEASKGSAGVWAPSSPHGYTLLIAYEHETQPAAVKRQAAS